MNVYVENDEESKKIFLNTSRANVNSARSQDTRSTHKNLFHFYVLTMNMWKEKLKGLLENGILQYKLKNTCTGSVCWKKMLMKEIK